jgi:hypothetical protein
MKWRKLGHIFVADRHSEWMHSHAMIPIAEKIGGDLYRIYFSPRDTRNRGHGAFLELDLRRPLKIERLHRDPVLEPGDLGCFDDSGALPNALVSAGDRKLLYYTGINLGVTVPIRNSIGLAQWDEPSQRFVRLFSGPIIDRTRELPHFVATPDVIHDSGFKAWFATCRRWEQASDGPRHFYNIEYAESDDGIVWRRNGKVAIDFADEHEYALATPRVIKDADCYRMWFCSRATEDASSYRLRYAESEDGVVWHRRDGEAGIDVSDTGWDSEMICYPFVFDHAGERYMLYNGNGYGRTGFGLAILDRP